jgi:hypothetical protein
MSEARNILVGAAVGGLAGFLAESLSRGKIHFSPAWGGAPIPFVPTYAVGGAALAYSLPRTKNVSWPVRAAAYGAGFTALEYTAGTIDRSLGGKTWSYGADGSLIDVKHAVAWAALGLLGEQLLRRL